MRRLDGAAPVAATARITEPVAAWYVADILRGAPPPENALAGRIAFKTGTSYGFRDAWAVGFDRRHDDRRLGRAAGRRRGAGPRRPPRRRADPVRRLRPARRRAGADPDAARMRSSPPPRRCRRRCGTCARTRRRPSPRRPARRSRSPIPLDGSRVELGFTPRRTAGGAAGLEGGGRRAAADLARQRRAGDRADAAPASRPGGRTAPASPASR